MAEPTLSLGLSDFLAEVGFNLGFGRGAAFGDVAYSTQQQADLDSIVKSGLRRFYYPTTLEGESGAYSWSFMHLTQPVTLANGSQTVSLPDDFGGFEGPLTILSAGGASQVWRIEWRNEGLIREMIAVMPAETGPPRYVTQLPLKGSSGIAGQRFQLLVYPKADQVYTLQANYYVNPDYITTANPYAYGGAQHIETILESCLAVAEERMDDDRGVHALAFQERLAASIAMDRKNKSQKLGPNLDRSDDRYDQRNMIGHYAPVGQYNGVSLN